MGILSGYCNIIVNIKIQLVINIVSFMSMPDVLLYHWFQVHFKVLLQPFHKEGMKARYEFLMSLNSTNPENNKTESDNIQQLTIPIWVETDLILQG